MFLANFLIALREGVEASLIVGVILAVLVKTNRRDLLPKMWFGVLVAAIIPLAAGALMIWGPYTLTFQAQEILGGGLSLVAVVMLTTMIVWVGTRSHSMAADLSRKAEESVAKDSSGWGLVWIAIISVGREGLETAIFIWATVNGTANSGVWAPTMGVVVGLIIAIVIGWLVYRGGTRINLRWFFQITGFFLIFVAAGILAYGIGDLQEASVLPGWGIAAYDISPLFDGHLPGLRPDTWWFALLEAIFNFNLAPTYLQAGGWIVYLVITLPAFFYFIRTGAKRQRARAATPATSAAPAATQASISNS